MTWQTRDAIADTSALLYLHLLRKLDLFRTLFARTIVPEAVWRELDAGARAGIDVPSMGALPRSTARNRCLNGPAADGLDHL